MPMFFGAPEVAVANGALRHSEQIPCSNDWSGCQLHGSSADALVVGPVMAGSRCDGQIEVFVIDQHSQPWNIRQAPANGPFTGWNASRNPEATFDDRPRHARSVDGRPDLFARGTDNGVNHQREADVTQNPKGATAVAQNLPCRSPSPPALAVASQQGDGNK